MTNLLIVVGLLALGAVAPKAIRGFVDYYQAGREPFIRMSDRGRRYDWCKQGWL